jgi:hypothetical protein
MSEAPDYTILIYCPHGTVRNPLSRAEYSARWREWNLPQTPAPVLLEGDELLWDLEEGVYVRQPTQFGTVRAKHRIVCPICKLTASARTERMQEVLTSIKDSNLIKLTLEELVRMIDSDLSPRLS